NLQQSSARPTSADRKDDKSKYDELVDTFKIHMSNIVDALASLNGAIWLDSDFDQCLDEFLAFDTRYDRASQCYRTNTDIMQTFVARAEELAKRANRLRSAASGAPRVGLSRSSSSSFATSAPVDAKNEHNLGKHDKSEPFVLLHSY